MDPIKSNNSDNLNVRYGEKAEGKLKSSFIYQKLAELINYIRNALKSIVYIVHPSLNPKYTHSVEKAEQQEEFLML